MSYDSEITSRRVETEVFWNNLLLSAMAMETIIYLGLNFLFQVIKEL